MSSVVCVGAVALAGFLALDVVVWRWSMRRTGGYRMDGVNRQWKVIEANLTVATVNIALIVAAYLVTGIAVVVNVMR